VRRADWVRKPEDVGSRGALQQGGTNVTGQFGEAPSLRHNLALLRRGLWIIVLTASLATAASVYWSLRETSLYRASAQVFLNTQNLAATLSNVQPSSTDPARLGQTQAQLARIPAVAARAIVASRVRGRTPDELLADSSVTPVSNADLLTFSVTDRDPNAAKLLATSYAHAYTSYRRGIDTATLVRARGDLEKQITQLEATGQQNSALYQNLVDKDQQLRTMELLQGSNAQVVRPAAQAAQVQPRTVRNAALGFVLGLMLGVGLAFLRDTLDQRIRSSSEIESRLGLPLLGRLPEPSHRLRDRDALVMLEMPESPEAEAFRILATNIEFVNLDRHAKTIMVTSAVGGEGKSTTVANLAVALARAGRRVALVDMDTRRPHLDRFLLRGAAPTLGAPGLTHVVLGRASLEDALVPVPVLASAPGDGSNGTVGGLLELLTMGPVLSNPSEFFASRVLTDVLGQLAQRADLVLVDTPPLLQVSDTIALSARVDALLVVTSFGIARRPVLNEMRRVLETLPVVKLGFVLTGAQLDEAYARGYGYGQVSGFREPSAEWVQRDRQP
jgi:tyrosine-protein kinase